MRIISFVGTRPEIIKTLSFCRAAKNIKDLEFLVFHTGQNFEPKMSKQIFEELSIPLEGVSDPVDRSSVGAIGKSMMDFTTNCIKKYSPDIIVSNTDTDSAFYAALAGAKAKIPVAHIEGGIRCDARLNPEEINRRLSDHLATWIFTISHDDSKSLLGEGFPQGMIFMHGDITLDALNIVLKDHQIGVVSGAYDLWTMHRQENTNSPERLSAIIDGIKDANFPTFFPVHPRTRDALKKNGLMDKIEGLKNVRVLEPQSYVEMLKLLAGSRKVISDSGGLRREAYMLDKPVIALVSFVWFKQMNALGYEFLADCDSEKIKWAIENYSPKGPRPPIFGDGSSAHKILTTLCNSKA